MGEIHTPAGNMSFAHLINMNGPVTLVLPDKSTVDQGLDKWALIALNDIKSHSSL